MKLVRRGVWLAFVAAVVIIVAEAMSRVDDAIRSGIPLLASPSSSDLTIQDSIGTRGRPFARYQKWRLNGAGFRGNEITLTPAPDCTRVAVMGASETFGYYESPGKEYPAKLKDSLTRTGCYEVINTAVTGLPLTGQIRLWDNWISRFQPNIVVIYASPAFYLANEPPQFAKPRQGISGLRSTPFAPRLLDRIHARIEYPDFIQRRRVMKRIASAIAGKPADWFFHDVPADRLMLFRHQLDSLVASVRATGAVPVLVTHAMRFGDPPRKEDEDLLRSWRQFTPRATERVLLAFERAADTTVRGLAEQRGIPVIDAATAMTGHTEWFGDFIHFNDEGAGVMAGRIARTVRLVPVKRTNGGLTAIRVDLESPKWAALGDTGSR